MKKYHKVAVEENGRTGRCMTCGEDKRLIKVNGNDLPSCKECFLSGNYTANQFFVGQGIDVSTAVFSA